MAFILRKMTFHDKMDMEVMEMSIKMIVTDLDGTFYHQDLSYDKQRFDRLYEKMKAEGIRFVVASGNQYYQLISFFDHPVVYSSGYPVCFFNSSVKPKITKLLNISIAMSLWTLIDSCCT